MLPGGSFATVTYSEHHGRALAGWNMLDGAGNVINQGNSYVLIGVEGRIEQMNGFFDVPNR